MKSINLLELFGGIGAPRKALENLNFKINSSDYVEVLPQACNAYNLLYAENYQPQDVLKWKNKDRKEIDLLVHGSPCQDFSIAGKNDLSTGRSNLYTRTLEIIEKELNPRPKYVVWENVKALTFKNNIKYFNDYLNKMSELGYINYWKVLNSLNYGIPQNRERVFVVSIRKDLNQNFSFDNLETKKMQPLIKFLENFKNIDQSYFIKYSSPSMVKAIEDQKIKVIDDNENGFVYTITTKQERWNNSGVIKMPLSSYNAENYVTNPKNNNSYIRTITATGANSRQKIVVKAENTNATSKQEPVIFKIDDDFYNLRIITQKEAWRLMGFTNADYEKVKHLSKGTLYKLAGNSIVVQVLEAIFKELFKTK
ncbi:DNA cytosine methyltransferase [Candidatus Mycoplasma pogonae]